MVVECTVIKNMYRDSVELMRVATEVREEFALNETDAVMCTPSNKARLREQGIFPEDPTVDADANDILLVAVGDDDVAEAVSEMEHRIQNRDQPADSNVSVDQRTRSLASAFDETDPNVTLISIPGEFAVREAWRALNNGSHIHLFSDNIPLADERELKQAGKAKGQLVMGPDCGTAIINGLPFGFANDVAHGSVGIVSASGTGLQEVSTIVDRLGGGISHAIGTGGRDLTDTVGGITTCQAIELLDHDDQTEVIVVISKPPEKTAKQKVLATLKDCNKPVILSFVGQTDVSNTSNIETTPTLEAAARQAINEISEDDTRPLDSIDHDAFNSRIENLTDELETGSTTVRGLFTGGTLCTEAVSILNNSLTNISSNTKLGSSIDDLLNPTGHALIDLGCDELTAGRPHPMIDPEYRNDLLRSVIEEDDVSIVLLDVVLGYGAHTDPVEGIVDIVESASDPPVVVTSVCGTDSDPQERQEQYERLSAAGITVASSNAEAAALVAQAYDILSQETDKQ